MRKLTSEFIGTFLLALSIVGAGAMAAVITRDGGLALFINAATAAGILGLIITAFGSISGGHFNPAVTIVALVKKEIAMSDGGLYIFTQIIGGVAGVITANYLFGLALADSKSGPAPAISIIISEVLSTAGLLFVIRHLINIDKSHLIALGVPLWIFTGYFFTPTSVIANPAMTISRALTNSYAGIAPNAVLAFVGAQLVGAILGWLIADSLKQR